MAHIVHASMVDAAGSIDVSGGPDRGRRCHRWHVIDGSGGLTPRARRLTESRLSESPCH